MAFDSFSEFIAMGGYGFYVWLSYGLTFLALAILIVNSYFKKNKILKNVEQRILREQRIKNAQNTENTL
jgi:heme exporter protein D